MKKLIKIAVLLTVANSLFASDLNSNKRGLICAYTYAQEVKDELGFKITRDKYLHCSVSCAVGLECGIKSSAILGVAKEVYDVFGPGQAEIKDLYANLQGLGLSLRNDVDDLDSCKNACARSPARNARAGSSRARCCLAEIPTRPRWAAQLFSGGTSAQA